MRGRTWFGIPALVAMTVGLSSCSYGPEYAVTLNAAGHVQFEACRDSSLIVWVDGAELATDDLAWTDERDDIEVLDLATVDPGRWTPAGSPTLSPDTEVRVWEAPRNDGDPPIMQFFVGDLERDRYLHDGEDLSVIGWHKACQIDDGIGIGFGDVFWALIAPLLCFGLFVVGIVWAIIATVRTRRNGYMPPQPR